MRWVDNIILTLTIVFCIVLAICLIIHLTLSHSVIGLTCAIVAFVWYFTELINQFDKRGWL